MQKASLLLFCFFVYIVLSSSNCNKKSNQTPEPDFTYQPTTTGSQWNYTTTGTAGGTSVNAAFVLTATSRDTLSNGRTYKVFTNSIGPNEYYNKSGNDYYRISSLAALPQPVEVLYLKDNQAAGFVWSETKNFTITGVPFPIPATLTFTNARVKYDTSFNGNNFKDVIRVRLSIAIPGVTIDNNDITYLFAKNVGMIANKVNIKVVAAGIDVNTETKLGTFTVK